MRADLLPIAFVAGIRCRRCQNRSSDAEQLQVHRFFSGRSVGAKFSDQSERFIFRSASAIDFAFSTTSALCRQLSISATVLPSSEEISAMVLPWETHLRHVCSSGESIHFFMLQITRLYGCLHDSGPVS
jgi:hypothetical protein